MGGTFFLGWNGLFPPAGTFTFHLLERLFSTAGTWYEVPERHLLRGALCVKKRLRPSITWAQP